MIEKVECERLICDGCGDVFSSAVSARSVFIDVEHVAVKFGAWVKEGNKHYCRKCAEIRMLVDD